MIEYYDKNGKQFKIHCRGVELLDNTQELAGHWSVERLKHKDFKLKEGGRSEFVFFTDQHIRLVGEGIAKCDGQGVYRLIGEGDLGKDTGGKVPCSTSFSR